MKKRVTRSSTKMIEATKALRTVRSASIRTDLQNQLRQAENALNRRDMARASAYMQALATTALMLRVTLKAASATKLFTGIIVDAHKNGIALPLVNYTDKARCVFNTGNCASSRYSKCAKIDGTWGCATVPRNLMIFQ